MGTSVLKGSFGGVQTGGDIFFSGNPSLVVLEGGVEGQVLGVATGWRC